MTHVEAAKRYADAAERAFADGEVALGVELVTLAAVHVQIAKNIDRAARILEDRLA